MARRHQSSGARFYYTGGAARPGIIDPAASITQFWLPSNPELYVTTGLTTPAMYVKNRTTGSYFKQNQEYQILSTSTNDFQLPDVPTNPNVPDNPVPFIPHIATAPDFIPILVDCTHNGIEAAATTIHEAGWLILDGSIVAGTYSSHDTDRGACPHVAPVAHFTMSGGGNSGSDTAPLEIVGATNVSLSAFGSERDMPIVSYDWYINGVFNASNFSSAVYAPVGSTGVSLRTTDKLGMSSLAEGTIWVTAPPPPPGGGNPPGGPGSGGSSPCIIWEISWDGGLTWLPFASSCQP